MTEIVKKYRRRSGAKKLDLTALRKALRDTRIWTAIGIVEAEEGRDSHIDKIYDGDTLVDVLVDVTIQPDDINMPCRFLGAAGSYGIMMLPSAGWEVLVALPSGRMDFQPTIVGILSTGSLSEPDAQGIAENRIVMMGNEVLVHDGNGNAVALALKSDCQSNTDAINSLSAAHDAHVHTATGCLGGIPVAQGITAASPAGTTILKAK